MEFCLYAITNRANGKLYIGQTRTRSRRWQQHLKAAVRGTEPLYRAMRKYGVDQFVFEPLITVESQAALDLAEIALIASCRSRIKQHGYNVSPGGLGGGSGPLRPETKEKIRRALAGRPLDAAHAAAVAEASRTPERREKLRRLRLGTRASVAAREAMSRAGREKAKTLAHAAAVRASKNTPEAIELARANRLGRTHDSVTVKKISDAIRAVRNDPHIEARVREIRREAAVGVLRSVLCVRYGLSKAQISNIVNRKSWKHVVD